MKYSTIETKEAARIGYNGFLFPVKAEVRRITIFYFFCHFSWSIVNTDLCRNVCFLLTMQVDPKL